MSVGKNRIIALVAVCVLVPAAAYPQAKLLARAGFIDLDRIVYEYSVKYLDGEIAKRENALETSRGSLHSGKAAKPKEERETVEHEARERKETLAYLKRELGHLARTGELKSDRIAEIIEKNVITAVRKTAELDGFSIVLDMSGNFVYGSREVDLTEKVLLRLLQELSGPAEEQ